MEKGAVDQSQSVLFKVEVIIFTDDNGWVGFARYAGAYRIATELRSQGYKVKVVDFFSSYSLDEVKQILNRFVTQNTLYIGFATSLWVKSEGYDFLKYAANSYEAHLNDLFPHNIEFMNEMFNHAERLNPKIRFVVGGSKAESLSYERIHHWVIGQGETAAVSLAHQMKFEPTREIPKIIEGKKLDYNGFTKSTIEWADDDFILPGEALPIEIARGCIFKCSFCYYPLNGKNRGDYTKSKDTLKNELIEANERFGSETFLFTDDLVNDSPEKVQMIYELSQELPFQLEWSGFCRLDMIYAYPEMAELLKASGMKAVYFGIETLNKVAGLKCGKGLAPEKTIQTLEKVKGLWGNSVVITGGFIVGLPGEPKESVKDTMRWLLSPECPIDAADIGVLNIKARKNLKDIEIYSSRISEQPNKFGIEVTPDYWKHELMDSNEAFQLVKEFYSTPEFAKKTRGAPFTMYPRLKNLGFTFAEVSGALLVDGEFTRRAIQRRNALAKGYLQKILGLDLGVNEESLGANLSPFAARL